MKSIILLIAMGLSFPSFAEEASKKSKEEREQNREEYDDNMQAAGKWDFISNSFFLISVAGLGSAYYAIDKMGKYEGDDDKPREDLTDKEKKEYNQYDKMLKGGIGAAAGGFLLGLGAYGMSVSYERDAYSHALKVGIEF